MNIVENLIFCYLLKLFYRRKGNIEVECFILGYCYMFYSKFLRLVLVKVVIGNILVFN